MEVYKQRKCDKIEARLEEVLREEAGGASRE
jgi:hypothetical protein